MKEVLSMSDFLRCKELDRKVRDQIKTELASAGGPDIAVCYPDHVALFNKTTCF